MKTILTSLTSQDFLSNLRTQTTSSHNKLESLPISTAILSPKLEMSDYIKYLSIMYDVHKEFEEKVLPQLSGVIDNVELRKKTQWIKGDMLFLHHNFPAPKTVFERPRLTIAFSLGMMYVVEGSTLGSRLILKNIETVSGLNKGKGVSYFTGYGSATGSNWKSFLNVLIKYERDNNCEKEIIEGAIFAFDCIYDHFLDAEKR